MGKAAAIAATTILTVTVHTYLPLIKLLQGLYPVEMIFSLLQTGNA